MVLLEVTEGDIEFGPRSKNLMKNGLRIPNKKYLADFLTISLADFLQVTSASRILRNIISSLIPLENKLKYLFSNIHIDFGPSVRSQSEIPTKCVKIGRTF